MPYFEKIYNVTVFNLPPDKNGKLDAVDVENLMHVADALNIRRTL